MACELDSQESFIFFPNQLLIQDSIPLYWLGMFMIWKHHSDPIDNMHAVRYEAHAHSLALRPEAHGTNKDHV